MPIHPLQKIESLGEKGCLVKLDLMINRELEREIMSYGDHLKVVSPKHFQKRMKELYRTIEEVYDEE